MPKFRVTAYDNSFPPQKLSDKTYEVKGVALAKANLLKRNKDVAAIFVNDKKVH